MNHKAYEALHAFIEGGSVAQAALRLHRTQPQVSRLLAQLEADAGFAILRREGRRLKLTEDGRRFYHHVYGLLRAQDALTDFTQDIRQGITHRIRILAANHIIDGLALEAMAQCRLQQPTFSASLTARMPADLQWWLGQQQFDVALVQLPLEHPAIETELLVKSEIVAVVGPEHPLRHRAAITAEDVERESFITLGRRSVLGQRYEAAFETANVQPAAPLEVSFSTSAVQLAAYGCGIAMAEPFSALAQRHTGAVLRRFMPTVNLHYGLVFPKDVERPEAVHLFVKHLRACAKRQSAALAQALDAQAP